MKIVPATRPKQTREASMQMLRDAGVTSPVALLGIRGYYRDSMGAAGRNDRGIYDDAIFVVSPTAYVAFNANTDPSSIYCKGLAVLMPGVYYYRKGSHNGPRSKPYPALCQASAVTVIRDGVGERSDDPVKGVRFGINIHKGGHKTTSSLGCQTIYPAQWESFLALVYLEMARHNVKLVPYLLAEQRR